jgi:Hint module
MPTVLAPGQTLSPNQIGEPTVSGPGQPTIASPSDTMAPSQGMAGDGTAAPTPGPTGPPVTQPAGVQQAGTTTGGSDKKACFAGSERVTLESGSSKFISDVLVGDRVLVADASGDMSYSQVVFIPHGANKDRAIFTHITTHSGRDIKMTQNHILPAGTCSLSTLLPLVYASQVSVGDCIMTVAGQERVSAVEKVRGEGVYTVVTNQVNLILFSFLHLLPFLPLSIPSFFPSTVS